MESQRRSGAARRVRVGRDGARVVFLHPGPDRRDGLWVLDVVAGQSRLVADPAVLDSPGAGGPGGIADYATDPAAATAAFVLAGRLYRAALDRDAAERAAVDRAGSGVAELTTAGPATDPQPDPTGRRVAYVTGGALRVTGLDGGDTLLAGEAGPVEWGRPEPAAVTGFHRDRGYWWAPDGGSVLAARVDRGRSGRYPRAGDPLTEVTLHLLDLDGGWVDVHWDRETYPYLVAADWSGGGPLITVLRRPQQHGLVLAVDPRTGETQVHAELADPRWVEPIVGTPCHLADGRVLVGGELAHDGYDARCLLADGTLLTPPSLYVRRVVGRIGAGPGPADLLVEASEGEPSEQHLYRVRAAIGAIGVEAMRLTTGPGWHVGAAGADVLAVGTASLDSDGTHWTVWRGGERVAELAPPGAVAASGTGPAGPAPRPVLERVTDRRLPAAVVYPRDHVAGRRLPVLVWATGEPGRQGIRAERASWLERQWWADGGFAVVTVDHRGTAGVAPSFEKVVHRRLADVVLTDQVDGLTVLAGKHLDLDLGRVAIRGAGFGGWLAGLAVLRRPETFHAAVVTDPLADWRGGGAAYAERYLGRPDDASEVYAHHSLVELAVEPPPRRIDARPIRLVGAAGALGQALRASGRPHELAAAPDPPAELTFLRRHLPPT